MTLDRIQDAVATISFDEYCNSRLIHCGGASSTSDWHLAQSIA